jgi:hypothetical protein
MDMHIVLFQLPHSRGYMLQQELKQEAQPLSEKSFTIVSEGLASVFSNVLNWFPLYLYCMEIVLKLNNFPSNIFTSCF